MAIRSRRIKSRQSNSFSKRKKAKGVVIFIVFLVAIGACAFGASRLTTLKALSIETVEIFGADEDISDDLRTAALTTLEGKAWGIFSRSSTVSFPRSLMESRVKEASARIDEVSIKRKGLHGLAVTVKERTPAALICASLPDFAGDASDCYFADKGGFVFKDAVSLIGLMYPRYYIPDLGSRSTETSSNAVVGTYATSTAHFSILQSFYEAVRGNGIDVQALLIKEKGQYELYAPNPSPQKNASSTDPNDLTVIYFTDTKPLLGQLENLVSFWKRTIADAADSKTSPRFDYIDVRFGPNVFYRLAK